MYNYEAKNAQCMQAKAYTPIYLQNSGKIILKLIY